jgi:hypothetical protein
MRELKWYEKLYVTVVVFFKGSFMMYNEKRAKKKDLRRVKKVIKLAELQHKIDGKTYYVIRNPWGRPFFTNNDGIKDLKRKGWIDKHLRNIDFYKSCLAIVSSDRHIAREYQVVQKSNL